MVVYIRKVIYPHWRELLFVTLSRQVQSLQTVTFNSLAPFVYCITLIYTTMKKSLLLVIVLFMSCILYAQEPEVVFTRFDLKPYSAFIQSDGWNLRSNFKVKGNKAIKYMEVFYLAVNSVGDAVEDKIKKVKKFSEINQIN